MAERPLCTRVCVRVRVCMCVPVCAFPLATTACCKIGLPPQDRATWEEGERDGGGGYVFKMDIRLSLHTGPSQCYKQSVV